MKAIENHNPRPLICFAAEAHDVAQWRALAQAEEHTLSSWLRRAAKKAAKIAMRQKAKGGAR